MAGVWVGLDVAWDVYIGLETFFFTLAMIRHPKFGVASAIPGLAIGFLILVLNPATFPTPPSDAGLADVEPFVGLWHFTTAIRAWSSFKWARERLKPAC